MSLKEFCQQVPKVELHAHLSGSVREKTIVRLLKDENKKQLRVSTDTDKVFVAKTQQHMITN